ncbi:MAG: hypothetical protein M1830_009820 [Pleopsidium flavum]|nr:MAG: hypothetical protein M1830_009820 [Pleopsidium flavum]
MATRPLSIPVLLLFEALLFIPLLFSPFTLRGHLFFPVLLALYIHLVTSTTGSPATDWSLVLAITPQLFKASDVLLLTDAERDLRWTGHEDENPADYNFRKKLAWAIELVNTPRGVGWNWEVPYICYVGTSSRRQFILSRLPRVIIYYLLLDFLEHLNPPSSSSSPSPSSFSHLSPTHPFTLHILLQTWSFAIKSYLHLWLIHTLPALFLISTTTVCPPSSFPYVMGPVGAMSSVRKLWGRTWHQAARRQIRSHGIWLAGGGSGAGGVARKPGSVCSAYVQLATGFAIGGFTHAVAGCMATAGQGGWWHDGSGAGRFFVLQFLAVVVEDLVIALVGRSGMVSGDWRGWESESGKGKGEGKEGYGVEEQWFRFDSWQRVCGYVWVVVWLSVTMAPYVEGLRRTGVLETRLVPFSVMDWVGKQMQ